MNFTKGFQKLPGKFYVFIAIKKNMTFEFCVLILLTPFDENLELIW